MNKGQTSSQDKESSDGKLNLNFETNYILSLIDKFKYISKRIDKNNPLQVCIFLFIVGWLIPCILAILNNVFLPSGKTGVKCFSFDLSMYAFYVFSLPILIYSEKLVSAVLNNVIKFAYHTRVLNIEKVELQKFINIAKNRVESPIYHILLLVFAYISSFWWIGILLEDHINTWHGWNGTLSSLPTWHGWNGTLPSLPGFYVTLISIPLGLYVMYLWAWRAIVWVFFIWTITKDPKKGTITVEPLHCDGCGGLFFFSKAIQAWGYLFLSMGCVVFLDCFNYVYIQEASLFREDIMAKVGVYIILAPFLFLLQPLFFRPHLANAKWHFLDELQKDYMYSNAQDDPKVENVYYEDKYNKVMSMKVWLLDMKMTTKYLIAIGTALGPLINKLLLKIKLFY